MPYIFQSDLCCDACGKDIQRELREAGVAPDRSSDIWPQRICTIGESDTPDHCGCYEKCVNAVELPSGRKIGALLHTDLTTAGVQYVREAIAEGGEVAEFWLREFTDAGYDLREGGSDDHE